MWWWSLGLGRDGLDRDTDLFVKVAVEESMEYVAERSIDIYDELEGSHQVSLSLFRLPASISWYSAIPSSDQIILTRLLSTFGASTFFMVSTELHSMVAIEKLEIIIS